MSKLFERIGNKGTVMIICISPFLYGRNAYNHDRPSIYNELSERVKLYEDMGNPTRAVKDWERCIANIGDHEGVTKIRARIDILKKKQSRIHYNRNCSDLK